MYNELLFGLEECYKLCKPLNKNNIYKKHKSLYSKIPRNAPKTA